MGLKARARFHILKEIHDPGIGSVEITPYKELSKTTPKPTKSQIINKRIPIALGDTPRPHNRNINHNHPKRRNIFLVNVIWTVNELNQEITTILSLAFFLSHMQNIT